MTDRRPSRDGAAPALTRARIGGGLLRVAGKLSRWPFAGSLMRAAAYESLGIAALQGLPRAYRGELPDELRPIRARAPRRWADAKLGAPRHDGWPRSARSYVEAFVRGDRTPLDVARTALDAMMMLARRTPSMNVLAACDEGSVCEAARQSIARLTTGRARALEGVPFLVKDQHDVAGLPTSFGSRHVPAAARADATVVDRLRAAGAIVLGKSVMTEWGATPFGSSVHTTLPRNPFDPSRAAGGSSTGSAVGVALGFGPFATGADAGGSVRVPAAYSGVVGLKPTFGRLSRAGETFSGSLNHVGVLGACVEDVAFVLDATASEPDPRDPMTAWADAAPPGGFGARIGDGVASLRIGLDERDWDDCPDDLAAPCRRALDALVREGAVVVPIRIPLAAHAPAIGIATMACEGAALATTVEPEQRALVADDLELAMGLAAGITGERYLDVQRLRAGLRRQLAAAMAQVDVIAMPVAAAVAPRLEAHEVAGSFADPALAVAMCRYSFLANLTGAPAISVPVGLDRRGLPVGLQLVGDAWDEASLLAVAAHVERIGRSSSLRARDAVDLLAAAVS